MVNRSALAGALLGLVAACGGKTGEDSNEQRSVPGHGGAAGSAVGGAGVAGGGAGVAGSGGAVEDCFRDETLPHCAFTESCTSEHLECSVSEDCTITFDEPVPMPSSIFLGCEPVPYAEWWYSETGRSIFLSSAKCDAWHAAGDPPVLVELVHSCIV